MEKKGIKVSRVWVSPKRLVEFRIVIKNEKDLQLKKKYKLILWGQILLIPVIFIGFFILLGLTR